jgi:hypothetical protein
LAAVVRLDLGGTAFAVGRFGAGAFALAAGLAADLVTDFGADRLGAARAAVVALTARFGVLLTATALAAEALAAVALAAGFALPAPGGFTLAADLALVAGWVFTVGFGLGFAAGLALDAGVALTANAVLATGLALDTGVALMAALAFIGAAAVTAAIARGGRGGAGAGVAGRWGGGKAVARGSPRLGVAGAAFGAGGVTTAAGTGSTAAGATTPLAGGRGPRSPTRTGSTISCVSSAWRSGVSAVSRHVKATTSLVSECLSNRTIAVWLKTVSTTPREPTG